MLGRIKDVVKHKKPKPHIGIDEATGTEDPKVLEGLLTEEPELVEALENTRMFLNKSASQETLNIVFNHRPKRRASAHSIVMDSIPLPPTDFFGELLPLSESQELLQPKVVQIPKERISQLPLDKVFGHVRYSKSEVLQLRGVLGYTTQELGDHAVKLGRNLYIQYREEFGCDCSLHISGVTVIGHKIVFASFSAVLCDMYSAPDNSPEVSIILNDLSRIRVQARAVKRVFKWMYTGRVKLGKYGCDIKKLAEQLNIKFLLKVIAKAPIEHAGDHHPPRPDPKELFRKEMVRKSRGLGPAPLIKKTSEMSSNVEMTNEEVADLAQKAAVKLGLKSSADALVEQIEKEEMDDENKRKIVLIRIPPPLPFFEPDAFYVAARDPHWTKQSAETVFTVMSSDYIQIRSEVDIYEAALRWLNFDYYKRKIYMQQLMDCPRWVHMTVEDMVKVRTLDTDFFHHKDVNKQVSRARWYQDLQKRGVTWNDYQVPPKRFM